MSTTGQVIHKDEVARLGSEIYSNRICPSLQPEDDGKFVAIDVHSGEYEVDVDDLTAVKRLRQRRPDSNIWMERAGHRTYAKLRSPR